MGQEMDLPSFEFDTLQKGIKFISCSLLKLSHPRTVPIIGVYQYLYLFIFYLATWGLGCGTWDLALQHTDPLVVACMLSCSEARGILVP